MKLNNDILDDLIVKIAKDCLNRLSEYQFVSEQEKVEHLARSLAEILATIIRSCPANEIIVVTERICNFLQVCAKTSPQYFLQVENHSSLKENIEDFLSSLKPDISKN